MSRTLIPKERKVINTVSDLKSHTPKDNHPVLLKGKSSQKDGFESIYYWDSGGDASAADGEKTISSNVTGYQSGEANEGVWRRVIDPQIDVRGPVRKPVRDGVTSNINTASTDYYIGVDTSSSAVTVTLRTADATAGREIIVQDQGGNANTNSITIQTEGTETISTRADGNNKSSLTINNNNESLELRATSSGNWIGHR